MAGGTFIEGQNKVRPGLYINFIAAALARIETSERGITVIPMSLDWGNKGDFIEVENADLTIVKTAFARDLFDNKLLYLREALKRAKTVIVYCLNTGTKATKSWGTTAQCTATAKKAGSRGNALSVKVTVNPIDSSKKDVRTYLDGILVDEQTVVTIQELKANDFIVFSGSGNIETTPGITLASGSESAATNSDYVDFLGAVETQIFDTIAFPVDDDPLKVTFVSFIKRLRDEEGKKVVGVVYNYKSDYEGIINVTNGIRLSDDTVLTPKDCVPWVAGASAGASMKQSLTYSVYEGAVDAVPRLKNSEFIKALKNGEFVFQFDGQKVKVEQDINSLTSYGQGKNQLFSKNRVIRTFDGINNDLLKAFSSNYIGKIDNNAEGQSLLMSAVDEYFLTLQKGSMIQNYEPGKDFVIEKAEGESVWAKIAIQPVDSMEKFYFSIKVR
ncbi:phage tail sheath family protein [Clostridium sp. HMP27]|uniref:phage tail sheath family protein n=1 Tax=Clostridium sp. HMP27 TaxID=1487921 RepID=UPI00052CD333|nr:phage tail sheath family protein [Clostridium sp. HMP27]KGK88040.1 hypothetical protein DP68_08920 [Clostridium sp. HMP27]